MPRIFYAAAPLLLLTAFPALASDGAQTGPIAKGQPTKLTPRQIHAYASALLEIQTLKQKLSSQLAKLEPQQADLLQSRAQAEMVRVVEKHGLDLSAFNAISAEVERQGRLRDQVKQLMMEELLST